MNAFANMTEAAQYAQTIELSGTVAEVRGLSLLVADLPLPVGATVRVICRRQQVDGQVVGFDDEKTIVMLIGSTDGIKRGDRVVGQQWTAMARVGQQMLGRVVDGLGRPIDGKGPIRDTVVRPLEAEPVDPMQRVPIDRPLGTGVRAIDTMLTVGRGQRLGVFSGPGIGKSILLGMMGRYTDADVTVIALVGERGREVRDFLDNCLGPEGLARSVVVVATGDEPALVRIRAAKLGCTIAEYFRAQHLDVVFLMDSITRFCQAQRQIGLASGEPPSTKGYPPSIFAMLPRLLERAGQADGGSITGFYSVLVEGDDVTEPVSDAVRGILDGHVVLTRQLANRAHWPAIDVLQSISRLANDVTDRQHQAARNEILRLISVYRDAEDLINIGAYAAGSNPQIDLAMAMTESADQLLQQRPDEGISFDQARQQLLQLALKVGEQSQLIAQANRARPGQPAAAPS